MLLRVQPQQFQRLAFAEQRQRAFFVIARGIVLAFDIHAHEAVELHHLPGCAEDGVGRFDVHGRAVVHRRGHLARDEAIVNQGVERERVLVEVAGHRLGVALDGGRANSFVRALRLLAGSIKVRLVGNVLFAIARADMVADGLERLVGNARRVGAHISDKADRALLAKLDALVQLLRDLHRAPRLKVELARGLLLEPRSDERGRRTAADFLALDAFDFEGRSLDGRHDRARLSLGQLVRFVVDAIVFVTVEPRLERRRIFSSEAGVERPVLFGAECLALAFAIDDYPQRNRLHASGADPALDLVPQQRTELVPDQPVEHPARLVRVEQVAIEVRGIGDGRLDRGSRNFMEQHAADVGLGLAEMFGDMPRDRLAFAVGVAGEVDILLAFGGALDLADYLLFALNYDVVGSEIMLDIYTQLAFGQVHHVADRGHDLVVATEVTLDGFRLCRRFDDYEIFCHRFRRLRLPDPAAQVSRPCKMPDATGLTPCQTYASEKSLPGCWVTRPSSSSSSNNLSTV